MPHLWNNGESASASHLLRIEQAKERERRLLGLSLRKSSQSLESRSPFRSRIGRADQDALSTDLGDQVRRPTRFHQGLWEVMAVRVEIPLKLPSCNDYINECRRNRFAGAKMKANAEAEIGVYLARLPRFEHPVTIAFNWIEKNGRRDLDGITFGK